MAKSKVLIAIPARRGSTRLADKPLQKIGDKTLVERAYLAAKSSQRASRVVVATDDEEIAVQVKSAGAEAIMTSPTCRTGTDRVAEVVELLGERWDVVVNFQGDMPFLAGSLVDQVIDRVLADSEFGMVTLATPIVQESDYLSPSIVKVVVTKQDQALYFSRAPIPHSRDGVRPTYQGKAIFGFKHHGLYAFRESTLLTHGRASACELEGVEMLEQLNLLDRGVRIGVVISSAPETASLVEVDTAADLARANSLAG